MRPPAQRPDLVLGREVLEQNLDRRGVLPEEPQGPAEERPVRLRGNADHDFPGLFARRLSRQPGRALGRGQDLARLLEKPPPGRRELDVPLDAPQQFDLELFFEVSDLLAQG